MRRSLKRIEAIIQSMTPYERENPNVLNSSRKKRIAAGSGTQVVDINRLLKQFDMLQAMTKRQKLFHQVPPALQGAGFFQQVADGLGGLSAGLDPGLGPDMGKVIGRQGRIAKEIRVLMRSAAQRAGKRINVEIID